MVCIYCGHPTQVANSRQQKRSNNVWRRRLCSHCQAVFTTIEQPELTTSLMVEARASGRLKPFSRDQLFISLHESCKHRPTALQDATMLTQTVTARILAQESAQITSLHIARIAHELLAQFDATAGAVYLAYHPIS